WSPMEVSGRGPVLPNEVRAHELAIYVVQAAVGLVWKEQLRQHRDNPRIDQAREDRQEQRQHHRRAYILVHEGSPEWLLWTLNRLLVRRSQRGFTHITLPSSPG